jgi:hypothetical protein
MMQPEEIKQAVREGVREELDSLGIDRETHAKHHLFLERFCSNLDTAETTVLRVTVSTIVLGIIAAITYFVFNRGGN